MGSISSVSHNRDVFVDKLFSFCLNQIMEQQSVRCGRKLPIRRRVWTEKNGARINGNDQNNFTSLPSVLQLLYFWGFPYRNLLNDQGPKSSRIMMQFYFFAYDNYIRIQWVKVLVSSEDNPAASIPILGGRYVASLFLLLLLLCVNFNLAFDQEIAAGEAPKIKWLQDRS